MSNIQKNNKPNVPNLRFPEFSGEWMSCQLGKIASLSKGEGISKDQRSINGNPCILYGELYTTYSTEIIDEVISKTNLPEKGLVKSKANDVIIPASGETAIDISTARCVTRSDVFLGGDLNIIRLKGQDGKFFSYQLNGVRKKDIAKVAQGVSIVHLHGSDLATVQVNYPSIDEQRKIAFLLSLLDQRIAIQNRLIEDLKKLKTALEDTCFYNCGGKQVCLRDILVERGERSNRNNQYEVLSSTVEGIYSQREYFKKEIASADNAGYKVIHLGDIVLSPQNLWMGNINYNDRFSIGIVSPSYKVFSIKPTFDEQFVASILKTKRALWKYSLVSEQGASIVRRNLNMEDFYEISFAIPSLEKQRRIGEGISSIRDKIRLEQSYLNILNSHKSYLLSKMFI